VLGRTSPYGGRLCRVPPRGDRVITLCWNLSGMPTTPHPANHPDSNTTVTSTERKEFAINTTSTDSHPEADPGHEPTNPSHRDDACCPCGALADRNSLCRKCRARATWERRAANRDRRAVRRRSSSRPTDRGSRRPQGRRPSR
ncbi:MAG: hypothetical protein ACRDSN_00775, partial [Pseudonocardiaceae bacterium]